MTPGSRNGCDIGTTINVYGGAYMEEKREGTRVRSCRCLYRQRKGHHWNGGLLT
jgi:hypothetical protein